jgi:Sec-independent protein translocase protein TatA
VKENNMLADIFGPDLLIVAIVLVVLLFGGAAIPKLARNLGSAKNQFEKGMDEGKQQSGTTSATSAASDAPVVVTPPPVVVTPPSEEKAPGA